MAPAKTNYRRNHTRGITLAEIQNLSMAKRTKRLLSDLGLSSLTYFFAFFYNR